VSCVHAFCNNSICSSVRLPHWLRVDQAQPFGSPTRLLQVFPALFPVCTGLGFYHVLPAFDILAQQVVLSWQFRLISQLPRSLFSSWSVEALISPNNCDAGHCTRSVDEGVASVGARIYRGSMLVVEWSERVSTSSSIGGAGAILNLRSLLAKASEPQFWLCRVASILHIVGGSGGLAPFDIIWLSYPTPLLILAHCVHLVSLYLLVHLHHVS
jgi:hypothetical protein